MPEILIGIVVVAAVIALGFVAFRPRKAPPPAQETRGSDAVVDRPEQPVREAQPEAAAPPLEAPPSGAPVEVTEPEPTKERPSLRERLSRSRRAFSDRLADVFGGKIDDDVWDDLEAALIQSDIGVETATRISEDLRAKARERKVTDAAELRGLLAEELNELFDPEMDRGLRFAADGTTVWMVVGVNGTGKTTTIGKLASDLRERGHTVALAASDTFRAAADEQLGIWADRSGAHLVKHQPGADPGAVAFDAYRFAGARSLDVLIVDTAGRLHTKTPLMDELSKVRRVIEKEGEVHEALLVIDATAGQNGLVQAKEFSAAAGVTGVVLTKLDGSAKGGIALTIEHSLGLPIKLIGVGEGIDDMEPFDPKAFVDALLS